VLSGLSEEVLRLSGFYQAAYDDWLVKLGVSIEHGVTGLLSPEKNIEQLAKNLLTLLNSNPLRTSFSSAGVKRTNRLFNIKWQCQILESIYQELC
jgi:glycosyltransferase involved in cell wall biosynthesis